MKQNGSTLFQILYLYMYIKKNIYNAYEVNATYGRLNGEKKLLQQ